jgi:hypothetical protein
LANRLVKLVHAAKAGRGGSNAAIAPFVLAEFALAFVLPGADTKKPLCWLAVCGSAARASMATVRRPLAAVEARHRLCRPSQPEAVEIARLSG